MNNTNDQTDIRKSKLEDLRSGGVTPYPLSYGNRTEASDALEAEEGAKVRVAGRMTSRRVMGKAAFAHIQDHSGRIQVYVRKDIAGEEGFSFFRELDIGDFIGVEGAVFITRTGEKTVMAKECVLLSKSLRPLPEKWHGLKDTELRYRKRYLDILVNTESREILRSRAAVIESIRKLLGSEGYMEVETPILQDIPGGAAARPFVTYHNIYDTELYMRIAPELYLKRLLVGGLEKVFEIGRNFRNEGLSTRHNPEFTMLEVYCAYTDYRYMMRLARRLVTEAARHTAGSCAVDINIEEGWQEKNLWSLISENTGIRFSPADDPDSIRAKAEDLDIPPGSDSAHKIIDRIFSKYVQGSLILPTFVTGYPAKDSPLAKQDPDNPDIAQRFELYIGGCEIANAYSEQNDPILQKKIFESQLPGIAAAGGVKELDSDYIEALEYGMPPASGLGIGIDRLVMILSGADSIREVILFPMLKPLK